MENYYNMIWELDAEYEDGTIINETRPYDNSKGEADQQYELECELIEENSYSFGKCTYYSVALVYD
jgi:hypothetical protein